MHNFSSVGYVCLSIIYTAKLLRMSKNGLFKDILASSTPLIHLCIPSFGWIFVPHGWHPAGLATLGEGANIQDTQHTATYAQLIFQDEAVLWAQCQTRSKTSRGIKKHNSTTII